MSYDLLLNSKTARDIESREALVTEMRGDPFLSRCELLVHDPQSDPAERELFDLLEDDPSALADFEEFCRNRDLEIDPSNHRSAQEFLRESWGIDVVSCCISNDPELVKGAFAAVRHIAATRQLIVFDPQFGAQVPDDFEEEFPPGY